MFEWRMFKRLPCTTLEDFEQYLNQWRKNQKTSTEVKIEAYIQLPPLFQELNCKFGLKMKQSKLRLNCLKSKLKGYKIELCERTKICQTGFQLWNRTIEKTMKKKAKIHLETFVIIDCKKSVSNEQQQQQQQQSAENPMQLKKQSSTVFSTKIQDDRQLQKESRFLVDQTELNEFIKKFLKTIKKKIQKYKINQVSLNEYVSILEQCVQDPQLTIVIVEKYPSEQNEFEECPFRLRVVQQKLKEMECRESFSPFYLTAAIHQNTENTHTIEAKFNEWRQKYEFPSVEELEKEEVASNYFIGGFPEFLTQFNK